MPGTDTKLCALGAVAATAPWFAALVLLLVVLRLFGRVAVVEGVVRTILDVTPCETIQDVERRLRIYASGAATPDGGVLPRGGRVADFDSYQTAPPGYPLDIVVVDDAHARIISVRYVTVPLALGAGR